MSRVARVGDGAEEPPLPSFQPLEIDEAEAELGSLLDDEEGSIDPSLPSLDLGHGSGLGLGLVHPQGPLPSAYRRLDDADDANGHHGHKGHAELNGGVGGEKDAWMHNIWAPPNAAVGMSYFCVGIVSNFLSVPLSYYLVQELNAPPAQQNVVMTLMMLPWSFKLVYGFISDNFPIAGMRRKPYFIMGWSAFALANLWLAALGEPSVQWLAGLLFLGTVCFMMSDVTTDAIVVERSKHEVEAHRGDLQATGYALRFCGSLVGSVLGAVLYNRDRWGWGLSIKHIFAMQACFPLFLVLPMAIPLRETEHAARVGSLGDSIRKQSSEVFKALCLRSVHVPLSFIFAYNVMQIPNAAWRSFLVDGLGFSSYDLGLLSVVGSLFSSVGLVAYKRYFMNSSWRGVYLVTTTLNVFFSCMQLLLIFRVNISWGIGDLAFALGDDALAEFVNAIQFLPVCQMYIAMCPDGAEGTTYAILTTLSNVAYAVGSSIGTMLTGVWDVSNEAMLAGNFTGMWKLTLLTSLVQPLPLLLVRLIPGSKEQQRAMQRDGASSRWGGTVFLAVLFYSLGLTIYEAVIKLM